MVFFQFLEEIFVEKLKLQLFGSNAYDKSKRWKSYQNPETSNFPPTTFGGLPHISALLFFLNMCFCLLDPLNTRYLPKLVHKKLLANLHDEKKKVSIHKSRLGSYPIIKTKQLAMVVAVVNSALFVKSHQPYKTNTDSLFQKPSLPKFRYISGFCRYALTKTFLNMTKFTILSIYI